MLYFDRKKTGIENFLLATQTTTLGSILGGILLWDHRVFYNALSFAAFVEQLSALFGSHGSFIIPQFWYIFSFRLSYRF